MSRNKLLKYLSPRYIVGIAAVVAAMMISSAIIELAQSRRELSQLMNKEASSLMKTILESSSSNIMANDEIESLIALRLLSTAKTIKRLDSTGTMSNELLAKIAEDNSVYRINIFDISGNKQYGSILADTSHPNTTSRHSPLEFIKPILDGEKDEIIIGLKEARYEEGKRFAVAIRRAANRKGAIVVNVDAAYMLQFENKLGFGKMISRLGKSGGMKYIALQKDNKIIAANVPSNEISITDIDEFLTNAYGSDTMLTRTININNEEYLEFVQKFEVNGEKLGLLRIAFNMDEMKSLESRMMRRAVILSIILIVIGVIVLSILNMNQNLKFVSGEYKKIQTFSGNILQNMDDSVITTDMQGIIRIFNRSSETLFRVNKTDAIGVNIFDFLPALARHLKRSLDSGIAMKDEEILYQSNSGEEKTLNTTTTFTRDPEGNFDSFTVVFRDLTEIKRMENTVRQKQKLSYMGELASKVAHEVRNPLNAMSMIAQRFDKEFTASENQDEFKGLISVMLSESRRVNNIIEQFLKFSRPARLNIVNIQSTELIDRLKKIGETACRSKNILFKTIEHDQLYIEADKDLMEQALLNLLLNAIDATPEGGRIEIEFAAMGKDKCCFCVKDSGCGIEQDKLKDIFELYYTTKQNGTGIGLSIVQQIVLQHNGSVGAKSTMDQGTVFTIELPLKNRKSDKSNV
jgi:two-component system, NtrC family, sensor histidine kinase HydH